MFNLVVEGNIGSGKSTFLKFLSQTLPNTINVFYEPVEQWRNLNGHNLFELMYRDPSRWSFAFQTYVQLTMMQMHDRIGQNFLGVKQTTDTRRVLGHKGPIDSQSDDNQNRSSKRKRGVCSSRTRVTTNETESDDLLSDCLSSELKQELRIQLQDENHRPLNVMERSIFSARYIFIENLFQSSHLTEVEYMILNESFEYMVKRHDIQLDLIVYLRCPPDRCYQRMLSRSRPEETNSLTLENFNKFHELHERFLSEDGIFRNKYDIPVLVIESLDSLDEMQKAASSHSKIILDSLHSKRVPTSLVC